MRMHQWPRGPLCMFKHAEPASISFILPSYHLNSTSLLLQTLTHTHHSLQSSSSSSFPIIIAKWLAKEKALQGNHPQGLVAHLPAAKPHKKLRASKPQLMRKGDKFLVRGRRVREQIFARGWQFMYDLAIPINVSLVHKFYANHDQKNQPEVYIRGRKIPSHIGEIKGVLGIPRLEGKSEHRELGDKVNKNILNNEAWMWMKLAVCNILPTRHGTTLGVDHILLIDALIKGMTISLSRVMVLAMNDDPKKSMRQILPFPMFITKWAEGAGLPTYPGDEIFNPTRKELMRALRRNEHIMHRHEQLLLMPHPGIDTSQLERVSSAEVSEHQQQPAGDPKDEAGLDEDSSEEKLSRLEAIFRRHCFTLVHRGPCTF
ncbi:hypothetical protein PIB30_072901 [Stylosanthes scabra]|uniref:Putative plant transposon protein domain-containing protein n=1 Tax=Stylosanthes scabra TaxID=79078 RepID=A0ABU6ZMW4_9FABA|nr:hypothetical protein [Stylosanthes scabra]